MSQKDSLIMNVLQVINLHFFHQQDVGEEIAETSREGDWKQAEGVR